jgi:hypothetical protein
VDGNCAPHPIRLIFHHLRSPRCQVTLFHLSEATIQGAIADIEANRTEVEAEYQQVLQDAEQLEKYYRDRQAEILAQRLVRVPKPGTEALWEKLRSQQARH